MNLREDIESALETSLEDPNGWGLPVELIAPDGTEYTGLEGQVIYETVEQDEVGNDVIVHKPSVTLRRSSLTRVPVSSELPRWGCRIPLTPSRSASKVVFLIEQIPEDGGSIGYITFRLTRAAQS